VRKIAKAFVGFENAAKKFVLSWNRKAVR